MDNDTKYSVDMLTASIRRRILEEKYTTGLDTFLARLRLGGCVGICFTPLFMNVSLWIIPTAIALWGCLARLHRNIIIRRIDNDIPSGYPSLPNRKDYD